MGRSVLIQEWPNIDTMWHIICHCANLFFITILLLFFFFCLFIISSPWRRTTVILNRIYGMIITFQGNVLINRTIETENSWTSRYIGPLRRILYSELNYGSAIKWSVSDTELSTWEWAAKVDTNTENKRMWKETVVAKVVRYAEDVVPWRLGKSWVYWSG